MSFLDVTQSSTTVSAAQYMRNKGGVVVAAGGNTGTFDTASPQTDAVTLVSGTDSSDARASWSSYGNYIDVAAPGVGIYTTSKAGAMPPTRGLRFRRP